MKIVDFHNHFVGTPFELTNLRSVAPSQRAQWEAINGKLSSVPALMSSFEAAGVAVRVINTPPAFIQGPDGEVPPETVRRVNDHLAETADKSGGKLLALATVDAFSGDTGAIELTRSVRELGLKGAFLECAKGDLLLDAPQARPVLAAAAALGIPVFIHPVTDPSLNRRFESYGRLGVLLARGTVNTASLFAMIEGGVFDEHPQLNVVVTTLAIGGLMLAGGLEKKSKLSCAEPPAKRRHVYIDTMGVQPALIRAAVEMVGADHVLFGTDWPIAVETSVQNRLADAFAKCGLDPAQQDLIAHGNALRLLHGPTA